MDDSEKKDSEPREMLFSYLSSCLNISDWAQVGTVYGHTGETARRRVMEYVDKLPGGSNEPPKPKLSDPIQEGRYELSWTASGVLLYCGRHGFVDWMCYPKSSLDPVVILEAIDEHEEKEDHT